MRTQLTVIATALVFLAMAGLPLAEAGPFTKREARQQKRIAQGVESGQLTAGETVRLERQQAKIEADREKAWSDGTLSKQEVGKLTREQNRASRRIYRLKHNDKEQPGVK